MKAMINAPSHLPPGEYIDKKELARRLKKSLRTINAWMQRGILPYYRIAHSVVFKWEEVVQRLEALREIRSHRNAEFKMQNAEC